MDPTTITRLQFVAEWYNWGAFVAFFVALLAVFLIFFLSFWQRKSAIVTKILSAIALVLTMPLLFMRLAFSLFPNQPAILNVLPVFRSNPLLFEVIAYVSMAGLLLAVLAVLGYVVAYLVGLGVVKEATRVCPQCGRPLDPSWPRCPYCPPLQPTIPQPAPPPTPPPLPPTEAPRMPVMPTQQPAVAPPPAKTELLYKEPEALGWLVIRTGSRAGKEFRLGESSDVGRDAQRCDVVIEDPAVSGQHARIRLEGGQFILYDLASTNGTFVNDVQIQKQALKNGDQIRMGNTTFVFMEVKPK